MSSRVAPRLAAALLGAWSCARAARAEADTGASAAAQTAPASAAQAVDADAPPAKPPEPRRDQPWTLSEPEEVEAPGGISHTAVYWIFGLGTPVGFMGFEGVHRFGALLEVAGGLGAGMMAQGSEPHPSLWHFLQWSLMPRLRLGSDHNALTLGAGLSGGEYSDLCLICDGDPPTTYPTTYTLWANFELGGEHWTRFGLAIRYFLGLARGFEVGSASGKTDISIPYGGLGIGVAF